MKVFSVSNRKGGVGKSTWTRIVATMLYHMSFGKRKLCIVDFDDQATTSNHRERELRDKGLMGQIRNMFPKDYKARIENLYPIYSWGYEKYIDNLTGLKKNFDFVFLDFPGNTDIKQLDTLQTIDKALIPVMADTDDIESSMSYMKLCNRLNIKPGWFLNVYQNTRFQKFIRDNGHEKYFSAINPNLEKLTYPDDHKNEEIRGKLVTINSRPEVMRVCKSTIVPYDDIENHSRTMVKWLLK
jgi:cellulose biosynthesis protein BcsQ